MLPKFPPPLEVRDPHLTQCVIGPHKCTCQMASKTTERFKQGARSHECDRQTHRPCYREIGTGGLPKWRQHSAKNDCLVLTVCREQLILTCLGGSLGNVSDAIGFRMMDFVSPGDFNCLQHLCRKKSVTWAQTHQKETKQTVLNYCREKCFFCNTKLVGPTWFLTSALLRQHEGFPVSSTNKAWYINSQKFTSILRVWLHKSWTKTEISSNSYRQVHAG